MLLCLTASLAQKTVVWENPTTEFGTDYGDGLWCIAIDVTRVELKKDETTVAIRLHLRSDYPTARFQFVKETYLLADGVRYPVVSADGIEFDKWCQTDADGKRDMVFHFKPMPLTTKVFDFIEGDVERAFQVKGIRPVEERHKMLFPSYWRNEKTGDWEIAFIGEHAIYDCKVWDMKVKSARTNGEADIVLENDGKTVNVMVGKDKKGMRTIAIDGKKAEYSMITERFMPYYPTKDTRTDFVDTNYKTDTATVVGWVKDIPERYRVRMTAEFFVYDLILNERAEFHADLDSLGRFSIKIPLANSSELNCSNKCLIRTMLEPGKTYFLLYDYKEGRRMWMGEDVRLQNELLRHPLDWKCIPCNSGMTDFDKYFASADSLIKTQHANIDELCRQHPTLSTRFNLYRKGNSTWQQAYGIEGSCSYAKDSHYLENVRKYIYENFWTKLPKPYTLYSRLGFFVRDYILDAKLEVNFSYDMLDYIEEIAADQQELNVLSEYKKRMTEFDKKVESITDTVKIQQMRDDFSTANADLIKQANQIFDSPRALEVVNNNSQLRIWQSLLSAIDSIGADKSIKSLWMAQQAYQKQERERKPLSAKMMDSLKVWIDNPDIVAVIEKKNEYYRAIANRKLDIPILSCDKEVQGMTDGEEILKKLLEPYKGKIVLIDVWGTWCGPCKEALSHSEEEYARLAKYDMQFVYLANNSPMDTWENVIKEYNVTGPNVAHFNLPREQQKAIERYLKVKGAPTYRIVDKQGNVLDMDVDARYLDSLEKVVKMIQEK